MRYFVAALKKTEILTVIVSAVADVNTWFLFLVRLHNWKKNQWHIVKQSRSDLGFFPF